MKKILTLLCVAVISILCTSQMNASGNSNAVKGVVVYDAKSDYHIVETPSYYVIVEWYGGPSFSRGDVLYGELHSYSFKMVKVNNNSTETKVYIENFWTTKEKCMEWLKDHNKL